MFQTALSTRRAGSEYACKPRQSLPAPRRLNENTLTDICLSASLKRNTMHLEAFGAGTRVAGGAHNRSLPELPTSSCRDQRVTFPHRQSAGSCFLEPHPRGKAGMRASDMHWHSLCMQATSAGGVGVVAGASKGCSFGAASVPCLPRRACSTNSNDNRCAKKLQLRGLQILPHVSSAEKSWAFVELRCSRLACV